MKRRGIHVMATGAATVPALERLIGTIAPSLGLDWVIMEINGHFQYTSHPEAAEANSISKEQAGKLAALARANGITLAPMYNCLGHQSWREKAVALLRSHPEFNEAPDLDATAKEFYCMSWCPNHPGVNPLVFDLFDELLDAFQAKAFNVGMDEVFVIGHCPRCKGTHNSKLLAQAVNDYHSHLVGKRGVEMQMWGDRLLDANTMGYGSWESSANDTWQAIDLVPKDIVMCDWHYETVNMEFPSIRFFQDKGFPVWPGGWNQEPSIRRFIEVARKESGPLMLGYLCTTWSGPIDIISGLEGGPMNPEHKRLPSIVNGVKLGAELSKD